MKQHLLAALLGLVSLFFLGSCVPKAYIKEDFPLYPYRLHTTPDGLTSGCFVGINEGERDSTVIKFREDGKLYLITLADLDTMTTLDIHRRYYYRYGYLLPYSFPYGYIVPYSPGYFRYFSRTQREHRQAKYVAQFRIRNSTKQVYTFTFNIEGDTLYLLDKFDTPKNMLINFQRGKVSKYHRVSIEPKIAIPHEW